MARVFGQRILQSPRGLNCHFLAHEWSHAEMSTRLTLLAWKRMPQWFDEGLAVALSEAPEHSENHWQFLINTHIPRPTRDELLNYQSLQQWLAGVHRFGDDKNFERVAQGQPTLSARTARSTCLSLAPDPSPGRGLIAQGRARTRFCASRAMQALSQPDTAG